MFHRGILSSFIKAVCFSCTQNTWEAECRPGLWYWLCEILINPFTGCLFYGKWTMSNIPGRIFWELHLIKPQGVCMASGTWGGDWLNIWPHKGFGCTAWMHRRGTLSEAGKVCLFHNAAHKNIKDLGSVSWKPRSAASIYKCILRLLLK